MAIDGIKAFSETVDLAEFFDEPRHVTLRLLLPITVAKIQEISVKGFKFEGSGGKTKGMSATPLADGAADRQMKVRDLKLEHSVTEHDITDDGQVVAWAKPLWKSLDELHPGILAKVLRAVDRINQLGNEEGEEDGDPT